MLYPTSLAALLLILFGGTMVLAADPAAPPTTQPAADISSLSANAELPDPFLFSDGSRVKSPSDWDRRRAELIDLFLQYEYGHAPHDVPAVSATEDFKSDDAKLHAKVMKLTLKLGDEGKVTVPMVLTMPDGNGPFPIIVTGDLCWGPMLPAVVSKAISRGYAICEFDRTHFAPDSADRAHGIFLLGPSADCGSTAAWAWGYSRVIDYLLTRGDVDAKRIIISGHSRGGKAVLLAGVLDTRVALTNPNASGSGGAGCFRIQGPDSEDLKTIVTHFPYWFAPRFAGFIGHIDRLPFDQHELKAMVAPRAFLETDSVDDLWANPSGSQQSWLAAKVVFDYLGAGGKIGIHYRHGKHAHNEEDWNTLLDFADVQLMGKTNDAKFDLLPFKDQAAPYSWAAPGK
jgi:hypothetical protein